MIARKATPLFWFSCLLVLCPISVFTQSQTTGRIVGTIKDQNGAGIVGAEVTVKSLATTEERNVTTNAEGDYVVSALSPGTYRVSITASGFKKAEIESVRVVITETTMVDDSLEVGSISQQTVIITSGPVMQTNTIISRPRK